MYVYDKANELAKSIKESKEYLSSNIKNKWLKLLK